MVLLLVAGSTAVACVTAVARVPTVARIPAVAGVPLVPDVLNVAGLPAIRIGLTKKLSVGKL